MIACSDYFRKEMLENTKTAGKYCRLLHLFLISFFAKVSGFDIRVFQKLLTGPAHSYFASLFRSHSLYFASLQYISLMSHLQRHISILFDQKDRHTSAVDLLNDIKNIFNDERRQS